MKSEQLVKSSEYCCGCSACESICPKKAITMRADEYGFTFPCVDEALCIDCGLCKSVCRFQSEEKTLNAPRKVFAGVTKTTDINKSASGGIFACVAKRIISDGGAAYGAAAVTENGDISVRCEKAQTNEELLPLLGSKYVQSNNEGAYSLIQSDLEAGKTVLFSGTPCQVDALYGFLKKDYENLFTLDLICHGVPSAKLFSDYLKSLEGKEKITEYLFRTKEISGEMTSKITFKNGKTKYIPCNMSPYFYLFINGYTYRESCYSCPFAKKERSGDITLGDFWGIEKYHPDFNSSKGVSCILVNTEKGERLIEKCSDGMELLESDFEKVAQNNAQLRHPSVKPEKRSAVLNAYKSGGFSALEKEYVALAGAKRFLSGLKLKAKKILK